MSHHFDTDLAKKDPRLNIADMYLFDGRLGYTTMVMTANTDAGISASEFLHDESLYSFRFRSSVTGQDEVVFKFSFGHVYHVSGDEHVHAQDYKVVRATGAEIPADGGQAIATGTLGQTVETADGVRIFVGTVPDMWASDAPGFREFKRAIHIESRLALEVFHRKVSYFERRNATAIVFEVPTKMVGTGLVYMWGNISLFGHAPEEQVSRYGLPLMTHFYLWNPNGTELIEKYHKARPEQDGDLIAKTVEEIAEKASRFAGIANPDQHARKMLLRVIPDLMPYDLGTKASYAVERFNGRPIADDALDVMVTLAAGVPVADGVAPPVERILDTFPYFGPRFSEAEQEGLAPFPEHDGAVSY